MPYDNSTFCISKLCRRIAFLLLAKKLNELERKETMFSCFHLFLLFCYRSDVQFNLFFVFYHFLYCLRFDYYKIFMFFFLLSFVCCCAKSSKVVSFPKNAAARKLILPFFFSSHSLHIHFMYYFQL